MQQIEKSMKSESKKMKELKRQYLESQSRWKDLSIQKKSYSDLLLGISNEGQNVSYVLSILGILNRKLFFIEKKINKILILFNFIYLLFLKFLKQNSPQNMVNNNNNNNNK